MIIPNKFFHFNGLPAGFNPKRLCSSFIASNKRGNSFELKPVKPAGLPGIAFNLSFRVFSGIRSTTPKVTSLTLFLFPCSNTFTFPFFPKDSAKKYFSTVSNETLDSEGILLFGNLP